MLLCRLTWIAEHAAATVWEHVDEVDTWPHDATDPALPIWLFNYVPTELRERVGFSWLLFAPVCMAG